MPIEITRRDFINGAVIGTGGLMLTGCGKEVATGAPVTAKAPTVFSPPDSSAYYPPIQTGMRGSHEGSFEVAHELAWRGNKPAHYETLNEHYDLIVVGAGMSGLAAARYYQQK
ncbi:MAG: NAD(P)/FAD-dependent oxidoreductase, partial [Luminiphilus sp.]|nr:NAD(P)/FAD-dependent oxidoreductase [Luminiphilus sp.]